MVTRFCPSLNGSLHLGHLWMAWLNWAWARQEGGRFLLRFDDLAPRYLGEDTSRQAEYRAEGIEILAKAGIMAEGSTLLSKHEQAGYEKAIGGQNLWLRGPALEGWDNVGLSPALVAARVASDLAEGVTHVIRGEELVPELQLYDYLAHQMGGPRPMLICVPRLRVCVQGEIETISKTYGNLQLRDLYEVEQPGYWVDLVRRAGLKNPDAPISAENIHPDPVVEVELVAA